VPDSSKDVKYMGVYVANVTAIEALKELLGISEPESQKPIPALRDELENDDGENDDGMPSEKPQYTERIHLTPAPDEEDNE